jgi:hypothetical protein
MVARSFCGSVHRRAAPTVLALAVGAASLLMACGLAADGPEPTAEPKSLPADWDRYFNEDARKPRFDQHINGILVGPTAAGPDYSGLCTEVGVTPQWVDPERAAGAVVDVNPAYLPDGVQLSPSAAAVEVMECDGTIVSVLKEYHVPAKYSAPDVGVLLWSGGGFSIWRMLSTVRAFPLSGAAERMEPISIKGRPAVLMRPVMPGDVDIGMGDMAIVIAEDFGLTAIQGDGLPLEEFIKIAEGLY